MPKPITTFKEAVALDPDAPKPFTSRPTKKMLTLSCGCFNHDKGYAEREPVHCLASEEGPSGTSVLLECQKCKSQWRENYRFIDDKRTDVSYEFVYDARK